MTTTQIVHDAFRDCPMDPVLAARFLLDQALSLCVHPMPDANLAAAFKLIQEAKLRLLQADMDNADESDLALEAERRRTDQMAYPSSGE